MAPLIRPRFDSFKSTTRHLGSRVVARPQQHCRGAQCTNGIVLASDGRWKLTILNTDENRVETFHPGSKGGYSLSANNSAWTTYASPSPSDRKAVKDSTWMRTLRREIPRDREVEAIVGLDNTTLVGRLKQVKVAGRYSAFQLTDAHGTRHTFDPQYFRDTTISLPADAAGRRAFSAVMERAARGRRAKPINRVETLRGEKQALIKQLMSSGRFLDNPEYYGFLQQHPDHAKKLFRRWYGNAGWIKSLERLGPQYTALAGDPGIASRNKAFLAFARPYLQRHPDATPFALRQAYAAHLGQTTVVRAMVLTERQAARIKAEGMPCFAAVNRGRAEATLAMTLDPTPRPRDALHGNLLKDLDWHVQAHTRRLLSMSVASPEYAAVAKSATHYSSNEGVRDLGGNKALYLFKLRVPELSLVRHSGQIVKGALTKFRQNMLYNTQQPTERYKFSKHEGIEMWTYFGVPRGSIVSMEKQTAAPVKYDFERKGGFF
jgi:hypothetical protein